MTPRKKALPPAGADLEPRVFDGPGKNEGFYRKVYAVVALVPPGRVTTYGDVGTILGSPRIARQVGWALAALPPGSDVPWHRVINAHGMVSWRGELARASLQEALLRAEGVAIADRGKLDLAGLRWHYPGVVVLFQLPAPEAPPKPARRGRGAGLTRR
ncbi:MAG: MGMT family protein [Myxococcota bacterium]